MERRIDIIKEICLQLNVKLSYDTMVRAAEYVEPTKLLRGKSIIKEGEICKSAFFIQKGLILKTYVKNGTILTEDIVHEGDIVTSEESLYKEVPSIHTASIVEPAIIYVLAYNNMRKAVEKLPEIAKLICAIDHYLMLRAKKHEDRLRFESSRNRYIKLIEQDPEVIRRAPLHNVASFLQMTPETLSRVRSTVNFE